MAGQQGSSCQCPRQDQSASQATDCASQATDCALLATESVCEQTDQGAFPANENANARQALRGLA